MNIIVIFDVLILLLGVLIIFYGIRMRQKGEVPGFFVPPEELKSCRDVAGFVKFLFPRATAFGIVCILFGVEGLVNDLVFSMNMLVNLGAVAVFLAAWVWFSLQLRRGRQKYME